MFIISTSVTQSVPMDVQTVFALVQILVSAIQGIQETSLNSAFLLAQLVVEMENASQMVLVNVNRDLFWISKRNSAFQSVVMGV